MCSDDWEMGSEGCGGSVKRRRAQNLNARPAVMKKEKTWTNITKTKIPATHDASITSTTKKAQAICHATDNSFCGMACPAPLTIVFAVRSVVVLLKLLALPKSALPRQL